MHKRVPVTLSAMALSLAVGCTKQEQVKPPPPAPTPAPAPAPEAQKPAAPAEVKVSLADVGLDAAAMDKTVDPCSDFYEFACGTWLKTTEIPADKSRWSRGFSEIDKRNEETLHQILEGAKTQPGDDQVAKKIGAYYGACMDEPGIEKAGIKPVEKLLATAKGVKDKKSLVAAIIELHRNSLPVVFDIDAQQDFKDATKMIAGLDQGGLGLPDRDYYLSQDEKNQAIRQKYQAHVERMLKLAGFKPADATKAAADVMQVETELAKVSKTRVERRDPQGLYNKVDRPGLAKAAPSFPWDTYFKQLGHEAIADVNVTSVPFFEGMNKLIDQVKPEVWRNYLQWHVIHATANMLPKAFVDENFTLTQALTGQKQLEERWKRCIDSTDNALGELLAQPFVKEKFAGGSKAATETMVAEISKAFGQVLDQLDWMDQPTRERAHTKLAAMVYHIGYPSKWKTYDFQVDPQNYAGNVLAARTFELKRDLDKIGKPVDKEEWQMTPPTVNAYYDPQLNEMVFPAGILQPPFFSEKAATAVNLGGMGMVVGHELTHGFDDEGSQFSADGNLQNWWEPAVGEKFKAKTQCIAQQYGGYEPLPGLHLNGQLTLGENIADNGGVKLAYRAYKALRKEAKERFVADGFTEDQQFFLAVGQSWCMNAREEAARMLVTVDPHSPPHYRVVGSLSNMPEFGEAFGCKAGTPMRPQNQCQVW